MVPEIILQRAIINGFSAIRKDPRILNMLFKNLPIEQQEDIKGFILEKRIDFSINYPRTDIKYPAIVMIMKSESESQEFLGDVMGASPNYDMPDADSEIETLGGGNGASVSDMGGLPALVLGNLSVDTMLTTSALIFDEDSQDLITEVFSENRSWPSMNLHVVKGAGAGKVYPIKSINDERLDIIGTFELDLDSTSVVDIRWADNPEATYGSPTRQYEQSTGLLRIGANYDAQYQLEVLAGNQEEVIYLYTVLKAILFAQRTFLEAQGIMSLKTTGTDLAPRSEMLPDEIFTRSMTVQFTYPFNFIVEQDVARVIQIALTTYDNAPIDPESSTIVAQVEL